MTIADLKRKHMEALAAYRQQLYTAPKLRNLFLELTARCNERCLHCGSRCGETDCSEISLEQYRDFLVKIRQDFDGQLPRICITGGEPLLRKDFFEIMEMVHELGFSWGMTSNGTLISEHAARELRRTGMGTVSISIDGLRETHDRFRQTPGGYDRAMKGIEALLSEGGFHEIQVTTVVTHDSIGELDALYEVFDKMDIDSWRVIGIEPIGRALDHPELLLTAQDQRDLLDFIRDKRRSGEAVTYGCSHYLGVEYECEVRDWYFLCNAGIYTASVMVNGDIGGCLDIERRPETIFGNIFTDDFTEVWKNRFGTFRRDPGSDCSECTECASYRFCGGGARHSWDWDQNRQRVCMLA